MSDKVHLRLRDGSIVVKERTSLGRIAEVLGYEPEIVPPNATAGADFPSELTGHGTPAPLAPQAPQAPRETRQQAARRAQATLDANDAAYEEANPWWKSAAQGAASGATFGFNDELVGAAGAGLELFRAGQNPVRSLADLGAAYRLHRDAERADDRQAEEANPLSHLAGDLAGSIPASVAFGRVLGKSPAVANGLGSLGAGGVAAAASKGALDSVLRRELAKQAAMQGAAVAGVQGGINALGRSEAPTVAGDIGNTVLGALGGALTGGVAGGGAKYLRPFGPLAPDQTPVQIKPPSSLDRTLASPRTTSALAGAGGLAGGTLGLGASTLMPINPLIAMTGAGGTGAGLGAAGGRWVASALQKGPLARIANFERQQAAEAASASARFLANEEAALRAARAAAVPGPEAALPDGPSFRFPAPGSTPEIDAASAAMDAATIRPGPPVQPLADLTPMNLTPRRQRAMSLETAPSIRLASEPTPPPLLMTPEQQAAALQDFALPEQTPSVPASVPPVRVPPAEVSGFDVDVVTNPETTVPGLRRPPVVSGEATLPGFRGTKGKPSSAAERKAISRAMRNAAEDESAVPSVNADNASSTTQPDGGGARKAALQKLAAEPPEKTVRKPTTAEPDVREGTEGESIEAIMGRLGRQNMANEQAREAAQPARMAETLRGLGKASAPELTSTPASPQAYALQLIRSGVRDRQALARATRLPIREIDRMLTAEAFQRPLPGGKKPK